MAKVKFDYMENPWLFEGDTFTNDDIKNYYGFVYRLTDPNGKMYIGKKFFIQKRKLKGATRRTTSVSDEYQKYFSSSPVIKELVKSGVKFKREILSLHELMRDVNYAEVKAQFYYNVLEAKDVNGERLYYNDNIGGKYTRELQLNFSERCVGDKYNSK